jgi:hypothetical protein
MEEALSFFSIHYNDPGDSPERQKLQGYKRQLEAMRDLFLYRIDYRSISKRNIDTWDRELRRIIGGIQKLRPRVDELLNSADAIQTNIRRVINTLYEASDILEGKNNGDSEPLYQKFTKCSGFLQYAINDFNV